MQISPHLYRFEDSCHVYVLVRGRDAVLIDIGTGDVLDHLDEFGVARVTDVLMTHHHRDQAQGLPRAAALGIRIWVPPTEIDLFQWVDEHFQQRGVNNYYNPRQDRFSIISSVPVFGVSPEYRTIAPAGIGITTLPTPGHTTGSVSYLTRIDGRRVAFVGDLLYGPGQVWSLEALQWTYTGHGGIAATVLSMRDVLDAHPDLLLPSHGVVMDDPPAAVAATEPPLRQLLEAQRSEPWDLDAWRDRPFDVLTPHLLRNRTANAQNYVLLSDAGTALFVDYGYDMVTDWAAGEDKAARRAWLPSLRALKRDFGIERVEVAIPTHYHDDHIAGFNLLRNIEGTEVWAEKGIAQIMAAPDRYDLPCLLRDAVPTDHVVPTGRPLAWREYEITLHPLPGHCLNQVAVYTEVDGRKVIATGDQQEANWQPGVRPEVLNYQYKNGFRPEDYAASARLYQKLQPELMLTGHWGVREVDQPYLDELQRKADELIDLHHQVLARREFNFGPGDFMSTIRPYITVSGPGKLISYEVEVLNPLPEKGTARVSMTGPADWTFAPAQREVVLDAGASGVVSFACWSPADAGHKRRVVLAADLTVDGHRFGQRAECLVDLR